MAYYEYRAFCGNIFVIFPQKSINYDIAAELLHRGTYKTFDIKPGPSPDEVFLAWASLP